MDIVMLHFIYDPFIPMIARRQMPDVILNHERVANHYLIPSINLCKEIGERMQNGEFYLDEFGGTHPKPFGHKFYAAAIGHLFDEMWKGVSPEGTIAAHDIPAKPLDAYSYYNGDFIALEKAHLNKGWKLVDNWHPDNKAGKRNGFVDVPMLEATRPGDRLTLDFRGKRSVFSASADLLPESWNIVSTAPRSKNWILSLNGATIFIFPMGLHAGNGTERHGSQTGSPHIEKEEPRLTGNGMPDTKFRGKRQIKILHSAKRRPSSYISFRKGLSYYHNSNISIEYQ